MANNDRETVIVDRGSNNSGAIIGIVVVVALLVIGYLVFFNGNGNNAGAGGTVDVDVPAVSVDVVPDGQ